VTANLPSTFVMHGARQILEIAGPAVHLEQQLGAIEAAVPTAPGLAADLSRTLVETVCKTILTDRGVACDRLKFNELLNRTYVAIQLAPDVEAPDPSLAALQDLAEHLDAAIGAISSLRHNAGVASHGKDGYVESIGIAHGEFAARAADALSWFLYSSHARVSPPSARRLRAFGDEPELNDWIDAANSVLVINGLEYRPSEVLFHIDRQAYMDALADFSSGGADLGEVS